MKKILLWVDVAVFLGVAVYAFRHAVWIPRECAGAVMAIVGFALWLEARRELGASFTPLAQARALVTTGLYARVRHPIYIFGTVAYCGLFLMIGYWIPFLCFMFISIGQVLRMRREDAVLEQAFGDQYRAYRAGTWI